MKDIPSFTINHERLRRDVYVSRRDLVGDQVVTTFDVRMKAPNRGPVFDLSVLHAIEHLVTTYLRSDSKWGSRIIYWGPMGCLIGNYLIVVGDPNPLDIAGLLRCVSVFMAHYEGAIPGVAPRDCGNYKLYNLELACEESRRYLEEVLEYLDGTDMYCPE